MIAQRVTQVSFLILAACVAAGPGGCGDGYLGEDDVRPGACAMGTAPPFQPQVVPSKDSANRYKILLFRGYRNVYSLGFDELETKMRGLNFSPAMVYWPDWDSAARLIVNEYASSPDAYQYVLVGHSYGADDAIRTARYLQAFGIRVRLLFLLDATSPDPVPDNVDRCVHYYQPWLPGDLFPDVFSGNPVIAESGNSRTLIENHLSTREALGDGVGCANHFSMDANHLMHNIILTELLQLPAAP